ncbi:lactonase family protein [Pedobacter steynii]|uniref:6-phosphogluconolactonase n=1 Tax=Pedobacter steynii TaxID=430522 RepID=A0A1D7QJL1_9SPHI|nr:lactonase family protein [Pedobacter steynii]AOM78866.1 hypothetical protein BFS30_17835 [Pedobacter steynii]
MQLIVGSYREATNRGIHLYDWCGSDQTFKPTGGISGIENPSYIWIAPQAPLLYAISEDKEGSAGKISIYELQLNDGEATLLSSIPFEAAGSCFISTDDAGRHAFIANYESGSLTVVQLPADGITGGVVQQFKFIGNGPDPKRQEQPHLHAALLSRDERFLYCSDLGTDHLYRFLYQPEDPLPLQANLHSYIKLPSGCGPRHLTFSPDGRWLYLITELSAELFVFDMAEPDNNWLQQIAINPSGYSGKIEGGDVQVDVTGRFLYASNRGDANEIVVFKIKPLTGKLQFRQRISTAGLSPRSILICEQCGLLLAANEQSDNVVIFKIQHNGSLELTPNQLHIPAPTCVKTVNNRINSTKNQIL